MLLLNDSCCDKQSVLLCSVINNIISNSESCLAINSILQLLLNKSLQMTNSTNKMIGKNLERRNHTTTISERKSQRSSPRVQSDCYYFHNNNNSPPNATPMKTGARYCHHTFFSPSYESVCRFSPNRTSPGLILGHFAGGKWSEPPSPTELPKPPQQWTKQHQHNYGQRMLQVGASNTKKWKNREHHHLKPLLNMQA